MKAVSGKILFATIAVLVLSGFATVSAKDKLRVVTSLPDLKSIAEFIGGEKVEVFAIATGFQNPHFVDPKPSYILKLSKADLFATVGLDLETGWVPPLLNSARNAKILKGGAGYVDASTNVPLLQVPSSVNRGEGDIHIYGNPHYWLDPVNGKIIAQNIYEALRRVDPEDQAYFQANLNKFNEQIDAKPKRGWRRCCLSRAPKLSLTTTNGPTLSSASACRLSIFSNPSRAFRQRLPSLPRSSLR